MTECEQHKGMHINWEYGCPEFLPSDDLPSQEFRLVTTGFHNPVMPFIRYDTGDIVRLYDSPRTCLCGRTMPMVHSVVGRKDECIITPDGRRLPSINFYSVFRQYPEILRFQIIQYGRSEVSARIALRSDDCDRKGLMTKLEQELGVRLGPMVKVEVEFTPQFITNADGKTLPIVRRLGTRSLEEREEYKISSQRAWEMDRAGEQVFKLDWNESDQLPSPAVSDALQKLLRNPHSIHWYPEAASHEFRAAIADYAGVSREHLLPTHGSDLAMELLATCFVRPGDKVLLVWPSYDNFRAVIEQRGAEIVKFQYSGEGDFPTDDFRQALRRHAPRLTYLVNPNNPIGYVINRDKIKELLDHCATLSTILIVDEAYFEFSGITAANLVSSSSHLVVTRSFSKAFGLAGLRLGYLLASGQLMNVLNRAQNAKSVTMFAKTAALAALQDIAHVQSYVEEVRQSRERYEKFFKQHGIKYFHSHGNFILFQYDAAEDLIRHMEQHRVFMRDRTAQFDGVGHIRVTVGGRASTEATISRLEEYFAATKGIPLPPYASRAEVPTRGNVFECR
jgi:histidinol-phosphate aminotransferase